MGYLPSINKFGLSYSNPRNVHYVLIENRQTQYIRFMNNYIEAHINEILAFANMVRIYLYICVLLFISTNKSSQCNTHLLLISL